MKDMDWQALKLFGLVAESGSLAAAAQASGISAPTLGRQMAALEKSLGRKLFIRHQTGYELAADGRALFEKVRAMRGLATDIEEWSSGAYALPKVTISAGTWLSRFLGQNLPSLWKPGDPFRLCFTTSEARLDLEHREADIGLRNARPQSGNLATRKGVAIAFAPYCSVDFDLDSYGDWVSVGREATQTPSSQWVHGQPELWISTWVSTPLMVLDVLRGGAGRGVLPCFIGDCDPALKRCGEPIDDLEHMNWIVMHDDERHRPEKRLVIDRISTLLNENSDLFAGMSPATR